MSAVPSSGTLFSADYLNLIEFLAKMKMAELKNRSLDRGITILEVLAALGACTLAELHKNSKIPKSTIRRLLGTLIARHIVRRSVSDKKYRINIVLPVHERTYIPENFPINIDAIMTDAMELTKEVGWPSDINMLQDNHMTIIDSTRPMSPFKIFPGMINRKINLFGSATGIACLATMNDDEIVKYHERTKGDQIWGLARFDLTLDHLLARLNFNRECGYGTRLIEYTGETILDDGLAVIAVPLIKDKKPWGGLTLLWTRSHREHQDFAEEFLPSLRRAAKKISAKLG